MRLLFYGSCRKEPSEEDVNEDRWAFSGSLGTLALCDGASHRPLACPKGSARGPLSVEKDALRG